MYEMVHLTQPYIAGFLAFREVGFLTALFDRLRATKPEFYPQLVFVDGNGRLHQRGFGLACHLGVLIGLPTIGVGKKLLMLDGLTKHHVQEQCDAQLKTRGEWLPLRGRSGEVWGAALRSTSESTRPIFVSLGHKISLETAVQLTQQVTVLHTDCLQYTHG